MTGPDGSGGTDAAEGTDGPGAAYAGFAGRVGETFADSRPAWPPSRRARAGSPNLVVVLVDDLGFSDIGPYGSEIPTPHLERLAAGGTRFSGYHTTPLCSPSRAALLTGINPHRAGFAYPANLDPGYPAYRFELPDDVATLAETVRDAGYATYMVGKWHLTGDRSLGEGADKGSWPLQRGFDRYFGSLEGFTQLHHPHRLTWDNSPYHVENYDDDHYLTDELTDRAIGMIDELRAHDADKPFLLYVAHHAVHGPIQAREADIVAQQGKYATGWDALREQRFARQLADGLLPAGTRLPADETDADAVIPPWDSLPEVEQRRFARYMEVYAAAVTSVDASLGRLMAALEAHGELDDTIIVFTSDNGGTAEGGPEGTRSYFSQFAHVPGLPGDWDRDVERPDELIGGPQSAVHYPRGWARVSNTPFRFFKSDTYAGGVRAPLLVHWPNGPVPAGVDRHQTVHVTDLTPTLLELAGIAPATHRHGRPVQQPDGHSVVAVLADPDAVRPHPEQYGETAGNRSYRTAEYAIVTRHRPGTDYDDSEWRLYDLRTDPTETQDLAAELPDVVADLAARWRRAAWENAVFPLPDHGPAQALRRPEDQRFEAPVTLPGSTPPLERWRSAQLISHRDVDIEIALTLAAGDSGVLVAHGDQGGGYVVAVDAYHPDRPGPAGAVGYATVTVNGYGRMFRSTGLALPPGEHRLVCTLRTRPGFAWQVALTLADGGADGPGPVVIDQVPQLLGMAPFTGISVGVDAGGPVDWRRHQDHGPHRFSGTVRSVRYVPGPPADEAPAERARRWAREALIHD